MRGTPALLAVPVLLALVGRIGGRLLPRDRNSPRPEGEGFPLAAALERAALRLLLGFGLLSLVLFVLVYLDSFTGWGLGVAGAAVVGSGVALCRRAPVGRALSSMGRDVVAGLLLALLVIVFGRFLPPFDLTLAGSDGSVYLAAAHELAAGRGLQYRDALVAEMTEEERTLFFERTSEGRLPGGIFLLDRAEGRVGFSFYHLLPAWLAFGLKTMGEGGDLRIWTLFPVLGLCASFLVARRLGDRSLAVAFWVVLMCFLPQAYFVRFPSSDLLAQALFLAGLAFLAAPLGRGEPVRAQDAASAGVLWAAMCLARVDSIPFLWIGLTLAAFACRRSGFGANAWLVTMAWVAAGSSLALFHQLSSGVYLYLPGMASAGTWLAGLTAAPWSRALVLGAALTAVALAHRAGERRQLVAVARAFCVLPAVTVLVFFASQWDWPRVAQHVAWISWYATPAGLVLLVAGLALGSLRWVRTGAEPGPRLALVMMLGPAFCYLVNPMVTRTQPWGVRRFVPMVFPLFLLLALLGWRAVAARLWRGRPLPAALTLTVLAIGVAAAFQVQSARVLYPVVTAPVRGQLVALARAIPERALVLISDEDTWLHLQTAFEHVLRRDTLVLPLAGVVEPPDQAVVSRYLSRQLARGRALFLLLARDETRGGHLPRDFDLELRAAEPLEYVQLPSARRERFPARVRVARLDIRLYELQGVARAPSWREIRIGDVNHDAGVLLDGFHEAEWEDEGGGRPYRWTGPVARLSLPPVAEAEVLLDTGRPPGAPPARLEAEVDGTPVEGLRDLLPGPQCLRLRLPVEPVAVKRVVTLRANAFSREGPQAATEARALGVRVFGVWIDGTCEARVP